MLFTPSVQVALRQHLRHGYWLSRCQPITPETVRRACKAIAFADAPEGSVPIPMEQPHVDAVLTTHQGFASIVDPSTGELLGWSIPEMEGTLQHANQSYLDGAQGRSERAKRAADARWSTKAVSAGSLVAPKVPPTASRSSPSDDF